MALGFSPMSYAPVGGSPRLATTSQVVGGVIVPVVAGVVGTASVGSVTTGIKAHATLVGFAMVSQLGLMSSVTATSPQISIYAYPPSMASALGAVSTTMQNNIAVTGVQANTAIGVVQGIGPASYLTGLAAIGYVGNVVAGPHTPWVEVKPSTTPGWVDVITHIPTN